MLSNLTLKHSLCPDISTSPSLSLSIFQNSLPMDFVTYSRKEWKRAPQAGTASLGPFVCSIFNHLHTHLGPEDQAQVAATPS